jgi:alkanesulfonate monooxygenase SsuD/methylene tetrahydromethanopterin reductase-like flavin-dependent oxidoreductase (luciferase family)
MHFQPGVCPAPLVELAGYAATTRRLKLGTTSLLLPLHPPEKIAAEIATLDQISEGRLLVGLGRGFQKPMLEAFGVPPAKKRDRFDEALDRILSLWTRHNARSEGSALQTYQRPHPPLAVAAFGPKGLAQAARRNLPYLASPVESFDQIAENQDRHRALLPNPADGALSLVMRTIFVSEKKNEVEMAREALTLIGSPEEVTRRLSEERDRLGLDLLVARPQIGRLDRNVLERSLKFLAQDVWPAVIQR